MVAPLAVGVLQSSRSSHRSPSLGGRRFLVPGTSSAPAGHGAASTAAAVTGTTEAIGTTEGWELLARGSPAPALRAFARSAQSHPADGLPKLGYALAAAEAGDLENATWAMRRAYRVDPGAAERAPVKGSLEPRLRGLIRRYRDPAGDPPRAGDSTFLLAALHDLLGEDARAQEILRASGGHRDGRPGTAALLRSLDF